MHAEYDESELPIPPERRRLRPNRVGQNDPPIRDGLCARALVVRVLADGAYRVELTADNRIEFVDPASGRVVLDFWRTFCPEEAI